MSAPLTDLATSNRLSSIDASFCSTSIMFPLSSAARSVSTGYWADRGLAVGVNIPPVDMILITSAPRAPSARVAEVPILRHIRRWDAVDYTQLYADTGKPVLVNVNLDAAGSDISQDEKIQQGLVGLDRFDAYNNHYGHAAGDEVIRTLAETLTSSLREDDFIARYGGAKMVVLLDAATAQTVGVVTDRLLGRILDHQIPHGVNSPYDRVTVSIGVGLFDPEAPSTAIAVLVQADEALYQARHAGGNLTKQSVGTIDPMTFAEVQHQQSAGLGPTHLGLCRG